jgi:hypothetical protein
LFLISVGNPVDEAILNAHSACARLHFLSIARFLSNAALLSLGMDDG